MKLGKGVNEGIIEWRTAVVCILLSRCSHLRYIDCLVQLSSIENTKHGKLIASQMLDVTIRVKAVRSYAVTKLVRCKFIFVIFCQMPISSDSLCLKKVL